MLGSGVSPGNSVVWLGVEKGVCDAQVAVRTQLRETLSVLVELADAEVSYAARPGAVVFANPGVKISEQEQGSLSLVISLFLISAPNSA